MIGKKNDPELPLAAASSKASPEEGKLTLNYKEKVVVKAIRDNAKDLQACYLNLLAKKPAITEGNLDVLFKVEDDGQITSLKITKNDFHDETIASCIVTKMGTYYLSPPPLGINRFMSHTLAFKSEASAQREAKEMAERNRPPKTLPVR